jgi:phosphohistidine phosphatase SixA
MSIAQVAMNVWRRRIIAIVVIAVGVFAHTARVANATEGHLQDLRSILSELRKGGYVIFLRHGLTAEVGATDEAADLGRCDTQRNLSASGRAQAAEIGRGIKRLSIPIGLVQASPFCRTKDTAQIAFGSYKVNKDLIFVMNMNAHETRRLSESLRQMLATPPATGTNSVLVSHSANLREAAGVFAKPEGVAYVFRPLGNGEFQLAAKIKPDEWNSTTPLRQPGMSP